MPSEQQRGRQPHGSAGSQGLGQRAFRAGREVPARKGVFSLPAFLQRWKQHHGGCMARRQIQAIKHKKASLPLWAG